MKQNSKNFVIDRSKWIRGKEFRRTTPSGLSEIFNPSALLILPQEECDEEDRPYADQMCCLGFYALACGLTEKQIIDKGEYSSLSKRARRRIPKAVLDKEMEFMTANDTKTLHGKRREDRLKKLFASVGVKVTFIGK